MAGELGESRSGSKRPKEKTLIYSVISVWFPLQLFLEGEAGLTMLNSTRASVIFEESFTFIVILKSLMSSLVNPRQIV